VIARFYGVLVLRWGARWRCLLSDRKILWPTGIALGRAVALFVKALRNKTEGCRFDSQPHYGPGVESASKRNEDQENFLGGKRGRCLGLTPLPLSYNDCLEVWELQPPGSFKACPGNVLPLTLITMPYSYCFQSSKISCPYYMLRTLISCMESLRIFYLNTD